jgi:hypothetical protein
MPGTAARPSRAEVFGPARVVVAVLEQLGHVEQPRVQSAPGQQQFGVTGHDPGVSGDLPDRERHVLSARCPLHSGDLALPVDQDPVAGDQRDRPYGGDRTTAPGVDGSRAGRQPGEDQGRGSHSRGHRRMSVAYA